MTAYKPILKGYRHSVQHTPPDLEQANDVFIGMYGDHQFVIDRKAIPAAFAASLKFDPAQLARLMQVYSSYKATCSFEHPPKRTNNPFEVDTTKTYFDLILESAICTTLKKKRFSVSHNEANSLSSSVDPDQERRRQVLKRVRGMWKKAGAEPIDGVEYQRKERAEWD